MATTIIRPTSDYSISTWKNSDYTTVNLYSYIDEDVASPTDSIGQISSDVGHCLFEFSDIYINGLINNVRIYLSFIANGVTAYGRVYIGGAEYSTSDKTLSSPSASEYGTNYFDFYINPATSLSWTKDDINNIIAGVYFDSTKAGKSIDQLYIEVDYTEPSRTTTGIQSITGVNTITF